MKVEMIQIDWSAEMISYAVQNLFLKGTGCS